MLKFLLKKMIPEYIPHLPAGPGGAETPVPCSDTPRERRRRFPNSFSASGLPARRFPRIAG